MVRLSTGLRKLNSDNIWAREANANLGIGGTARHISMALVVFKKVSRI